MDEYLTRLRASGRSQTRLAKIGAFTILETAHADVISGSFD
jgi:hypothetical protein